MRKKIYIMALAVMVSLFGTVTVFADEVVENENVAEDSPIIEYSFVPTEPIAVYEVNPDDYNSSLVETFAITGDVYSGSYNSTAVSLWNGLLANNVGKDYLAYRGSQYDYYIIFGEDFNYSNGRFTGSGDVHHLYTYGNSYQYSISSDTFTINPANNYVYTNVSDRYPALETERGLLYGQIQTIGIIALLGIAVLRWIFIGK